MAEWGPPPARFIVAGLIALSATLIYVAGLFVTKSNPVEPQSVFTLYGAILGYLFGAHDKDERRENREIQSEKDTALQPQKPQPQMQENPTQHVVRGTEQG